MPRLPTYFISHGGGPWPWIPQMRAGFRLLEESLARMPQELGRRPAAVLWVSGHWEAETVRVMHGAHPGMVYDYGGFPPETYRITYPAPGAPALAERAADLIAEAGLGGALDAARGFDHGVFAPARIIYPEADVPMFQVSLEAGYDPARHLALGRALAPLRDEGVLIVGSGLSYHNLRRFGPAARVPSGAFDTWLSDVMQRDPPARSAALLAWEDAPHARTCHAQEDHLIPLHVALGAAESDRATRVYHEEGLFGGVTASSWRLG
ncbi:MAG: dioxygenase [Rubellimicrobium sp.]|nr:dioxygenase [Rubellimicrobium sp.]